MPTHHQLGPTATIKKQRAGEEEKDEEEVEEDGTMGKREAMEIRGGIRHFLAYRHIFVVYRYTVSSQYEGAEGSEYFLCKDWRNIGEIPSFPTKRERGMTGCDDEREEGERKEEEGFLISPLLLILLRRQQQDGIERKRGGEKAF